MDPFTGLLLILVLGIRGTIFGGKELTHKLMVRFRRTGRTYTVHWDLAWAHVRGGPEMLSARVGSGAARFQGVALLFSVNVSALSSNKNPNVKMKTPLAVEQSGDEDCPQLAQNERRSAMSRLLGVLHRDSGTPAQDPALLPHTLREVLHTLDQ